MTNPTRLDDEVRLDSTLHRLQYILPISIVLVVSAYALVVEVFLAKSLPPWLGFFVHVIVFGVIGAVCMWIALGWVRQLFTAYTERAREGRAQERLLASITSNSADSIILLDTNGVIQAWNRGAELLFGYAASDIIGKHYAVLVPDDRKSELEQIEAQLYDKGLVRGWITRRVARDGREVIVELTRTLLRGEDGNIIGSSTILRDVTEREQNAAKIQEMNRQLETQVAQRTRELAESNRELRKRQRELEKANEDLKQLDQLKSEFVSLVSHELRAPLANISGSLELLLSDANRLTTNQRDLLTLANDQVGRLARLVRGILNVSRIEAGQTVLQLQAFDVTALVERMASQWQLCDNEHTYVVESESNLPSVWADRDRFEEVMTNLLENAFKYSDPHTEIHVRVQVQENEMVLSVCDRGNGIPSEDLQRIFDKFYRVERDDARRTYGYGLGLYISIKLVEAMGGKLWAESELDKGSTFYFSLPLAGHAATLSTSAMSLN